MLVLRAFLIWLAMLAIAVALGALRTALAEPALGEHRAQQVFVPIAGAAFALLIVAFVRRTHPTPAHALGLGLLWTALTVAFEFAFFHLAMGRPLDDLLREYNLAAGRLWPLLLLTILLTPWIAALARREHTHAS